MPDLRDAAAARSAAGLPTPTPVPVELDPATTALVVMDITDPLCTGRPDCVASVPGIASLLARARDAGAHVVHTVGPRTPTRILDEVEPLDDEPVVSGRADKFFDTGLDDILTTKGVRTLLLVGTAANGAVMYTAFGANLRGYTVVVAADGLSADTSAAVDFVLWQVVNQPGMNNQGNEPLAAQRVTVSRTDLVSFGRR